MYVPYFWLLALITQIGCVISILGRKDNPDYKLPWLLLVMAIPIAGFMCYLMFYSRKLSDAQIKKLDRAFNIKIIKDDSEEIKSIKDPFARSQATLIKNLADAKVYQNTEIKYFDDGETYFLSMLDDVKSAQKFIFMEYFIIERGRFWNSILDVLKEKVKNGVEVCVLYDDIGCITTLPSNYFAKLRRMGISAAPYSILRGQANNEFNNRNHRKITVIDGKIGYTGGINIADEYINEVERFGHWKDAGIRLEGEAVNQLTRLFLCDYEMSVKKSALKEGDYFTNHTVENKGFCMPFGDGPKPIYDRQVAKTLILSMLGGAKKYVYITTPYLIVDNELVSAIENAALRGVDVRIITPHVPDKKLVMMISRSYYERLIGSGVKIYEYQPGFIHAKTYLSDDKFAIVGTINLDYRSLVHHFENGVWVYNHEVIKDIKEDFTNTLEKSMVISQNQFVGGWLKKFFIATLKVFTPLF